MSEEKYQRVEIGKYIVADPYICHGKLTVRGTQVLVHRVIKSLSSGGTIDEVATGNEIPREAVVEGLHLAAEALLEKYRVPYPEPPSMEELLKAKKITFDEKYQRVEIGEYIVADPYICHGKPTFRGTRVMVHFVLRSFRRGETINRLALDYQIPPEAVVEGLRLAAEALVEKYAVPYPNPLSTDELLKMDSAHQSVS